MKKSFFKQGLHKLVVHVFFFFFFIMAQIQKIKLKYHLAQQAIPLPMSLLLQHKVQSHRVLDVQPQASQLLATFLNFFFLWPTFRPGWRSLEPRDKHSYICSWLPLSASQLLTCTVELQRYVTLCFLWMCLTFDPSGLSWKGAAQF